MPNDRPEKLARTNTKDVLKEAFRQMESLSTPELAERVADIFEKGRTPMAHNHTGDSSHPCDWVVCPRCGSENAVLIDWRPDDDTTLKCLDCLSVCSAEYHDDCAREIFHG